jgi:FtsH-binding integral membrane protein
MKSKWAEKLNSPMPTLDLTLRNPPESTSSRKFTPSSPVTFPSNSVQLAVTVGFCILAYNIKSFLQFQIDNPVLLWVSFGLLLVIEILIICTSLGKTHPINLLLLLGFTLCESYSVSYICSQVAQ